MKRWLMVVIGSVALVALWALPPSPLQTPQRRALPEETRRAQVETEVRRAHAALRAIRWSDSLSALAVRTAVDGVVLEPPALDAIDPAAVRAWEAEQRETLAQRARRDPRMVVGIFFVPAGYGSLPGVPMSRQRGDLTFVGEREGTPYCVRAIPHSGTIGGTLLRFIGDAEACRLYAAFGLPGPRIQQWLDASALGFARVPSPSWATDFARRNVPAWESMERLFGRSRPLLADGNLEVQACLAGRAEACERAVTDPDLIASTFGDEAWLVANSPVSSAGPGPGNAPFGPLDDGLLYEIEARFGAEAFAAFWTSTEPVPQAFAAAFGVSLGAWVLEWVGRHSDLYRAGPSLPAGSIGWSFLTLAALAVVATAAGVRRRVG